ANRDASDSFQWIQEIDIVLGKVDRNDRVHRVFLVKWPAMEEDNGKSLIGNQRPQAGKIDLLFGGKQAVVAGQEAKFLGIHAARLEIDGSDQVIFGDDDATRLKKHAQTCETTAIRPFLRDERRRRVHSFSPSPAALPQTRLPPAAWPRE